MEALLNKPYVNEVTLTGQNVPLKCCWPFELLTQFWKDLDISILKIGHQFLRMIRPKANSNLG